MSRAERLVVRGRKAAERLMVDTCRIRPVTGHTTNPADPGEVVATYGAAVYEGKCKIQNQRIRYPSNPEAGEHSFTVGQTELHVPVAGSGAIATGQVAEILTALDDANVGRVFRVRIGDRKTYQSAIRLLVEEVVA